MEDSIINYTKSSLSELLAIIPPIYLFMTILTAWIFIPLKSELTKQRKLLIVFVISLFWGMISLWVESGVILSKEGAVTHLIGAVVAAFFIIVLREPLVNWFGRFGNKTKT